jgi:hypothetical protein
MEHPVMDMKTQNWSSKALNPHRPDYPAATVLGTRLDAYV